VADEAGADLILIDGAQGWRGSATPFAYMRACERCTRTPSASTVSVWARQVTGQAVAHLEGSPDLTAGAPGAHPGA
jgi:hypothetical protein